MEEEGNTYLLGTRMRMRLQKVSCARLHRNLFPEFLYHNHMSPSCVPPIHNFTAQLSPPLIHDNSNKAARPHMDGKRCCFLDFGWDSFPSEGRGGPTLPTALHLFTITLHYPVVNINECFFFPSPHPFPSLINVQLRHHP